MNLGEIARRHIEKELEQIGEEMGMVDSRCIADCEETDVVYEDRQGNQHIFTFAPIPYVEEEYLFVSEIGQ